MPTWSPCDASVVRTTWLRGPAPRIGRRGLSFLLRPREIAVRAPPRRESKGHRGAAARDRGGRDARGKSTWRGRGLSKSFISRVIIGVPFRVLITLLITYLLSPLPLQVGVLIIRIGFWGPLYCNYNKEAYIKVQDAPAQSPATPRPLPPVWGLVPARSGSAGARAAHGARPARPAGALAVGCCCRVFETTVCNRVLGSLLR